MNVRLCLVIALTGATGCGEDSALNVKEVVAAIAKSECARFLRCCTSSQLTCTAGHSITEADCEELVALALRELTYVTDEAVDQGRRSVDEDAMRTCTDAIDAANCASDFLGADLDTCEEIFPGEQRIGDECFSGSECVSGTWCEGDNYSDRGVCVPLQVEGEICFDHGQCARELYCSANDYVCLPRAADGSHCESGGKTNVSDAPLCLEGLDCNDDERCEGPAGLGETCGKFGDCENGLVCGSADTECINPLADGEPCLYGGECESGFCDFDPGPDGECAPDDTGCWVAYGAIGLDSCEP